MLDTIYIGMSGLTSFSRGLSNISSNVANLNTTGFKGSELQFLDLFYQRQLSSGYSSAGNGYYQGSGVKAGESSIKFTQGDFRQTGNDLDAAITGNGFFVVKKDNKTYFTRAGQFEIDDAGLDEWHRSMGHRIGDADGDAGQTLTHRAVEMCGERVKVRGCFRLWQIHVGGRRGLGEPIALHGSDAEFFLKRIGEVLWKFFRTCDDKF